MFLFIIFLLLSNARVSNSFQYKLLGEWKVALQSKNQNENAKVQIYPEYLNINIKNEMFGGIITTQQKYSGSYFFCECEKDELPTVEINLQNEFKKIDSLLGIEVSLRNGKSKVRGRLCAKFLNIGDDVVVLEIFNHIYKCKDMNSKGVCLLTRIIPSDSTNITPINLLLIGQFVGFLTSHMYDNAFNSLSFILNHNNEIINKP